MQKSQGNGQSKKASALESLVNIAIGFAVGLVANLAVLPLFGYEVTVSDGAGISVVYTAISFCRSYFVRRLFNKCPA